MHGPVAEAIRRINDAWVNGRAEDLAALVHPDVVLALPGFGGREVGRMSFVAGHREFAASATIHGFREHDQAIDVVGDTAVVTYRYELDYERSGERYRSLGRDLWVFRKQDTGWLAVWRTILDVEEHPIER